MRPLRLAVGQLILRFGRRSGGSLGGSVRESPARRCDEITARRAARLIRSGDERRRSPRSWWWRSRAWLTGSLPGFGMAPGHSCFPWSIVSSSTAVPGAQTDHVTSVTCPSRCSVEPSEQASARRQAGESVGHRRRAVTASRRGVRRLRGRARGPPRGAWRGGSRGTSAATGPMAASRSASAHPARYVMTPPFEIPVTKTRDASTGTRRVTSSRSARRKSTSLVPPSSQRRPIACGYATTKCLRSASGSQWYRRSTSAPLRPRRAARRRAAARWRSRTSAYANGTCVVARRHESHHRCAR